MTRNSCRPLSAEFYARDVVEVARDLLGCTLIRTDGDGTTIGRIVETEAYLAEGDSACHGFRGQTRRNATMFGPAGRAYVYSIHSRFCLNAVTGERGHPSAVLIRAVEPLDGLDVMRDRRGFEDVLKLTRGPGRLCEAFAIDRALDGWDLTVGERLWIGQARRETDISDRVVCGPRVGVTSAEDLPLRFCFADCPFVSGRRARRSS